MQPRLLANGEQLLATSKCMSPHAPPPPVAPPLAQPPLQTCRALVPVKALPRANAQPPVQASLLGTPVVKAPPPAMASPSVKAPLLGTPMVKALPSTVVCAAEEPVKKKARPAIAKRAVDVVEASSDEEAPPLKKAALHHGSAAGDKPEPPKHSSTGLHSSHRITAALQRGSTGLHGSTAGDKPEKAAPPPKHSSSSSSTAAPLPKKAAPPNWANMRIRRCHQCLLAQLCVC